MRFKRIIPYALSLLLLGCAAQRKLHNPEIKRNLEFAFISDTHFPNATADSVVSLAAGSGAEFILHGGDIVQEPKEEKGWETAQKAKEKSGIPWFPCVGNHDGDRQIKRHFSVPDYYGFEQDNCYFLALNTQETDFEKQFGYAKDKIKSWKGRGPIFVYFHKPIFSSQMDLRIPRKKLETIFRENGVDFVLMGHEHHYTRFHRLNGVEYIISGCGSTLDSSEGKVPGEEVKFFDNNYLNFIVRGDSVFMKSVNMKGRTIDSLAVNWRDNDHRSKNPFIENINYLRGLVPYILHETF